MTINDPVHAELERMRANWQALKDDLQALIDSDYAVHAWALGEGDLVTAVPHGALVSANSTTLGKMRELEAPGAADALGCRRRPAQVNGEQ
jgi:hypothetical protein